MFNKQWNTEYEGNIISVLNTWGIINFSLKTSEAKLYINGEKQDECNHMLVMGKEPIMQGKIDLGNGMYKIVKVYMKSGLFSVQTKICIDDIQIGGDRF
ncbi:MULTISPECIES: hypothetical protein [Moorena]|uniref:Uncharacterized protein n=1 Tax=Moorena producens 3L TaxID=489825 RepID=F4XW70_9CYAN|nr:MULTISPECIES: hypothetical protein [Moorena]NEQ18308.1 hypothetical protein [Moorena sp. SIO3E2]EGJ31055.1 hypothetical protein LYNGBM3L_42750 [Moorena producens 3L]NEP35536.1 hypothetical protein [Moorena sp. SIO3B2]NEP67922.1 hypothetical protein [Moorena sp. SIO3A5]NEQ06089.1 hypothetical protein [Moorena sp. SIO4E2]